MLYIAVFSCFFILTETTIPHCSEYLVSGLDGVGDSDLTASGAHKDHLADADFNADNARLYSPQITEHAGSAAWCARVLDTNSYIQVKLPRETVVDTVMTQGRDGVEHWVTSFHLLHSLDGATWTTVTGADGNPRTFGGNSDRNTIVKTTITPSIRALYIRINPRTWVTYICLRFDLGGCQIGPGKSSFALGSVLSTAEFDPLGELTPTVPGLPGCSLVCHRHQHCWSFTYNKAAATCRGYNWTKFTRYSTNGIDIFYNVLPGYRQGYGADTQYKVNEIRRSNADATALCSQQFSLLIKCQTQAEVSFLQNIISSNKIMVRDFRFYVSGQYQVSDLTFRYEDGTEIVDSTLWASNHPDSNQGTCVMLTETGLKSVACTDLLYFICGN